MFVCDICTGDWHCAYVLLYGPRVLEIDPNEVKPAAAQDTNVDTTKDTKQDTKSTEDSAMES